MPEPETDGSSSERSFWNSGHSYGSSEHRAVALEGVTCYLTWQPTVAAAIVKPLVSGKATSQTQTRHNRSKHP